MSLLASNTGPRSSLDRVRQALVSAGSKPSRNGDSFMARCVCCDDKSPSLSVTWDASRGLTKLHAFCCEAPFDTIMATLGLNPADAFDEPMPDRRKSAPRTASRKPTFKAHKLPPRITEDAAADTTDPQSLEWAVATVYSYADEAGTIQQEVVREHAVDAGRTRKRFTQRFLNPATGRMVTRKPAGYVPVLYNHADVAAAIANQKTVYLLEGEKDVDNAAALGVVATTNAQGANSFPDNLVELFDGAFVNLVADRDVAGYTRAQTLHKKLTAAGAVVRLFLPAVDEPKADLTDHLDAGHSITDLLPIEVPDATALASLGEAERSLAKIDLAQREARAHVTKSETTSDRDVRESDMQDARTWADEAELQFRKIRDLVTASTQLKTGAIGSKAVTDLRALESTAANAAAAVHTVAGARIPTTIADAQKRPRAAAAPAEVIDISAGSGSRPPGDRGHDSSWDDDGEQKNEGARFRVRHGETVEVKIRKDGDTIRNRYEIVIRGWGQVQSVDVEDDGRETTVTRVSHGMTVKFWRWRRDDDGKPMLDQDEQQIIDEETVHWDADQIKDGSWANALPWPGMLAKSSRQGRETAMDALLNARQAPSSRSTVYTASGWRKTDAGWHFVHAGGAIASGGNLPLHVALPSAYGVFKLPEPSTDAAELRQAWIEGTESLYRAVPPQVLAPMLGGVWESVFAKVPMITHYMGGRAAAKTGLADISLQYFAPTVWFHGQREILSGSIQGGSIIGLARGLAAGSYLPVLVDDFAPDGQPKKIQEKLSQLARQTFNNTGRAVGKQRGGMTQDAPILASVITTGEMGTTGSADSRMMTIPIDPNMIPDKGKTLTALEVKPRREARALLGASLIRWIAQHRDALLQELVDATERGQSGASYWRGKFNGLPQQPEILDRLSSDAASRAHGIQLMLRMLVTQGALSSAEADAFNVAMEAGMVEAYRIQETSASDPAEQLLGYLRQAVFSGEGHFTEANGQAPHELETTLGWISRGSGDFAQWIPMGKRLGAIKNGRMFLAPAEVLSVVNKLANQADEMFSETQQSITSSFISHGWIVPDKDGKRSVGRRIAGVKMKVWDIPLDAYLGDGEAPEDEGPQLPPTISPEVPGLFDLPVEPTSDDAPEEVYPPRETVDIEAAPTEAAPQPAAEAQVWEPPAAPAAATAPVASAGAFRASLAVLHTDGLWFPDGENMQLPYPIEHLGDVARLVSDLHLGTTVRTWKGRGGVTQSRDESGQLLVTKEAAIAMGIPLDRLPEDHYDVREKLQELTANHPLILEAVAAGWEVGGPATNKFLNGVTRVWNATDRNLRAQFILIPGLKDDFGDLVHDDPAPATIARRLQRFTEELRYPFTVSASTTGLNLMETLQWKDRETIFAPSNPVPPAMISVLEKDINWTRKPTEEELSHKFVHAYDRSGSYLAAVSGSSFGIGDPQHFESGRAFDQKLPGYWLVEMPARNEWLTPNPIAPNKQGDENMGKPVWVSTPTLEIATDLGYELEPIEAYVWEKSGRILDGWYERVRDARTNLDTGDSDDKLARELLKKMYVRTLGLMGSHDILGHTARNPDGKPGYAPERYHTIQARAKANILRRVQQIGRDTGRWPIAIMTDTILYTSNDSDPAASWPGKPENYGRGLGQYKYEKSGMLADQLRYFTGQAYEGKTELDEWI